MSTMPQWLKKISRARGALLTGLFVFASVLEARAQDITLTAPQIPGGGDKQLVVTYRGVIRETTPQTTLTAINFADLSAVNLSATALPDVIVTLTFVDFMIANPAFMFWNGFLSMFNVASVTNKDGSPIFGMATLLNSEGAPLSSQPLGLIGHSEGDILVNNLPGFSTQGVGLLALEFDRPAFDGNGLLYRFSPTGDGNRLEYELGGLFQNPIYGDSYAVFNTMQPSRKPGQKNYEVSNWLQLANLSLAELVLTVDFYDGQGVFIQTVPVPIPPMGRRDIPAGHIIPGKNNVGLLRITPASTRAPYLAQVARYGASAETSALAKFYYFAQMLEARRPNQVATVMPITRRDLSENWLVLCNPNPAAGDYTIVFVASDGANLGSLPVHLEGRTQQHIFANAFLNGSTDGIAKVFPATGSEYIAESNFYYFDTATGETTAAYGLPSRITLGSVIDGSFNTYLGQENTLTIFNQSTFPGTPALTLYPLGAAPVSVGFLRGVMFDLQGLSFGPADDTVGAISLNGLSGQNLAHVLRLQKNGGRVTAAQILPLR